MKLDVSSEDIDYLLETLDAALEEGKGVLEDHKTTDPMPDTADEFLQTIETQKARLVCLKEVRARLLIMRGRG